MQLSLQNIIKTFDNQPALRNVSLDIAGGEIVCLLGPSGCGKTTLLRIIAGLETADSGQVLLDGQDLIPVPPHRRDFGLMFQDFALFPHKSVFENVAFGLRMQSKAKWKNGEMGGRTVNRQSSIVSRVEEMLRLVGLGGFAERSVTQLSGGEAQRVALARSLAPNPRLLMLDEPLGSLDRALRERLMLELRDILKRVGVTAVYVTHDQAEAFAIADRVIVMNRGRIEQVGPPEDIYRRPATPFVARFLGLTNLGEGRVIEQNRVASPWGDLTATTNGYAPGEAVTVLIRPEAARFYAGELSSQRYSPPLREGLGEGERHNATPDPPFRGLPPPFQPSPLRGKNPNLPPSGGERGGESISKTSPSNLKGKIDKEPSTNLLHGKLTRRSFRGGRYQVRIQPDSGPSLTFELSVIGEFGLTADDPVNLTLDKAGIVLLPPKPIPLPKDQPASSYRA